jgi:hypothetical protein
VSQNDLINIAPETIPFRDMAGRSRLIPTRISIFKNDVNALVRGQGRPNAMVNYTAARSRKSSGHSHFPTEQATGK